MLEALPGGAVSVSGLSKDDKILWRFISDDDIPLTNNEAEWALRGYVLWRKGSHGVCSHRGERLRQRILSWVETAKRVGPSPQEWLRAIVRACIETTDYPIPAELCASSPCRWTVTILMPPSSLNFIQVKRKSVLFDNLLVIRLIVIHTEKACNAIRLYNVVMFVYTVDWY